MASLWPSKYNKNKANWRNIWAKNVFFKKYVIPSSLLSFLLEYCNSFWNIVIPSRILSFLLEYCHSYWNIVIPSGILLFLPEYCHSFGIIVIPSEYLSFILKNCHSSESMPFQIFVILKSSCILPYPVKKLAGSAGHICKLHLIPVKCFISELEIPQPIFS